MLALGAAVVASSDGVHGEHPRFRLRVRVALPPTFSEEDILELRERSATSRSDSDSDSADNSNSSLDNSAGPKDPDFDEDDGPDGIGDGGDIDWTNWSWPSDVAPDVWGDAIGPFGQCGGTGYKGNETCIANWVCAPLADTFSECLPSEWVMTYPNSTVVVTLMPTKTPDSDGSIGGSDTLATTAPADDTSVTDTPATDSPAASSSLGDSSGDDNDDDDDGGSIDDDDDDDVSIDDGDIDAAPSPSPIPSHSADSGPSAADEPDSPSPTTDEPDSPSPTTDEPDSSSRTTAPNSPTPMTGQPASPAATSKPDTPVPTSAVTVKPTATGFQFESVPPWHQCGGRSFNYHQYATGPFPQGDSTELRCSIGYQCDEINEWFFQCVPIHDPNSAALWSQCGGEFYQGLTNCVAGSYCKYFNNWYSQCVPTKLL